MSGSPYRDDQAARVEHLRARARACEEAVGRFSDQFWQHCDPSLASQLRDALRRTQGALAVGAEPRHIEATVSELEGYLSQAESGLLTMEASLRHVSTRRPAYDLREHLPVGPDGPRRPDSADTSLSSLIFDPYFGQSVRETVEGIRLVLMRLDPLASLYIREESELTLAHGELIRGAATLTYDEAPILLSYEHRIKNDELVLRCHAFVPLGLPTLRVVPHSGFSELWQSFGLSRSRLLGDAEFDSTFRVRCSPEVDPSAMLTPAVQAELLAIARFDVPSVVIEQGQCTISWAFQANHALANACRALTMLRACVPHISLVAPDASLGG